MAKILVFGDSIAYGKWDENGGWVQQLRRHIDERYNLTENKNIQVYNLSVPGEIIPRLCTRVQPEMEMRIPLADTKNNNIVMIAVGINDTNAQNWISGKQTSPSDFKQKCKDLIAFASTDRSKCVIVGLTPINEPKYEERFQGRLFNKTMKEYDTYLAEVAKHTNTVYIPLFNRLKLQGYESTLVDGIHPNSLGHEMIYKLIKEFFKENELFSYIET